MTAFWGDVAWRRPAASEQLCWGQFWGILIGFGLKGMALAGAPWGPESGLIGLIGGSLSVFGLGVSVAMALFAALRSRQHPWLMQFASMNLLMIVVLLLS